MSQRIALDRLHSCSYGYTLSHVYSVTPDLHWIGAVFKVITRCYTALSNNNFKSGLYCFDCRVKSSSHTERECALTTTLARLLIVDFIMQRWEPLHSLLITKYESGLPTGLSSHLQRHVYKIGHWTPRWLARTLQGTYCKYGLDSITCVSLCRIHEYEKRTLDYNYSFEQNRSLQPWADMAAGSRVEFETSPAILISTRE